jgi:drug/metabolite transporter (DMT)-like permease
MPVDRRRVRAVAYTLAAVALWPVIEQLGGSLGARHAAVQIVWLRYAVHLLVLVAVCAPRGGWRALSTRRPGLQLVRGTMMFAMPMLFLLGRAESSDAWVWSVFWLAPLLVLAASPLLGEHPQPTRWIGTAVAWLGAALVLRAEPHSWLATSLALGMAGSFAAYVLLSRELRDEPLPASLFFTGVGALLPTTLVAVTVWTPVTPADLIPVLALGVCSLLFLYAADRALTEAPAMFVAPLFLSVVAIDVAVRESRNGTRPGLAEIASMSVILACMALLVGRRASRAGTSATRQDLS